MRSRRECLDVINFVEIAWIQLDTIDESCRDGVVVEIERYEVECGDAEGR